MERTIPVPTFMRVASVRTAARVGIVLEMATSLVLLVLRLLVTSEIVGLNVFQVLVGGYAVGVATLGAVSIFLVRSRLEGIKSHQG